jgi:hypothetical protein
MKLSSDRRIGHVQRTLRIVVVALLTFIWAPSATAATPAFGLELDVDGSSVEVTVTLLQSIPSAIGQFEGSGVLDRLIGAVPADEVDENGRPLPGSDPVLVSLEPVESGVTYRGSITVDAGEWAFFPWPDTPGFDPEANRGAPDTEFVMVGGSSPLGWIAIGAVAAIALSSLALVRRRSESELDV